MTPIDKALAALEEVREFFSENGDIDQEQLDFFTERREVILSALTAQNEPIDGLDAALQNAVKPHYNIHVYCPNCDKEVTTDNGEWLLWCGDKHHAWAILEAAKRELSRQK